MDNIVLPQQFDINMLSYNNIRTLDNGGKVVYISYNKKPLILQTPEMMAPFGLNKWNNEGKSIDKYSLDLSFKGKDERDVLNKFFENFVSIDQKLVHDGFVNCQSWFKKKYPSEDVVEALYTPIVKYPKDKNGEVSDKYPPTFKVNVPFRDGKFGCDVFDNTRNLIDLNNIETKGSKITAIIQCVGIWIAGGSKFGCSWKILQMKVIPNNVIKGYAFKEINDTKTITEDETLSEEYIKNSDEEY